MFNLSTLSGINLQTDNYFQYTSVSNQTSLCFNSNALAFESKCLGVFSLMPKRFSKGYFLLYLLAHPVAIILVMEGAIYFQFSTSMEQGYRRVMNAVEHICLDHRIMNHVFKYDPLSYLQFVVKLPAAHIIATQATVSSQAVDMVFPSRRS